MSEPPTSEGTQGGPTRKRPGLGSWTLVLLLLGIVGWITAASEFKWALYAWLALGALALVALLAQQNKPLLRELREHRSLTPGLLFDTLRIWAPLGLVVLGLWAGARCAQQLGVDWLYRYTTLDEFCALDQGAASRVIPCTDFDERLAPGALRPAGVAVDVSRHLYVRYGDARRRLLATPLLELRTQALDRSDMEAAFAPAGVLGLPARPPLDPLLLSLFQRRQALIADPLRKAQAFVGDMLPQLKLDRGRQELAAVDARIRQRLQALHAMEFGHLAPAGRARAYARNRIAIPLGKIRVPVDPGLLDALARSPDEIARLGASTPPLPPERSSDADAAPTSAADPDEPIRRGIVRSLADSEAAAYAVLSQRVATPAATAAAYELLAMPRLCTVAAGDPGEGGENSGLFPCFAQPETIALRSLGFRDSARLSIDRWREQAAFDAHLKLAELDREVAARALDARQVAERATALVPTSVKLGRKDCHLWQPQHCVLNEFAAGVEASLASARNEAVRAANEAAARRIAQSSLTAREQIDAARLTAPARIDAIHASARDKLELYFDLMDLLATLGYAILALIVGKSLLYVLALELFHKDSKLAISFDADSQAEGSIEHGPMLVIDKHFPHALITKKQLANANSALQWIAWPKVAPLHRLLRRRYAFFNRGTFLAAGNADSDEGARATGMVATAESPLSVVQWKMAPGEEVVFSFRDFYGASENVELEKEVSLRLSTLLLGRWSFHYARCTEGEGILLLKARVQAVDQKYVTAIPRARLVAWNRHMRFKADSQRHPWRSLVNDFTLVRSLDPGRAPGKWVTAPERAELGTLGRLAEFLKSVFAALF